MRTIRGANPLRFEKKKNKVTTDRRCIFLNVESIGQPYRFGRDQFRDQRIEIDRVGVASDSCINENRISTCYVPSLRLEGFMGEPREILTRSPLLGELVGLTNGGFFLRVDDKRPFTPGLTSRGIIEKLAEIGICERRDRQFLEEQKGENCWREGEYRWIVKLRFMKIIRGKLLGRLD